MNGKPISKREKAIILKLRSEGYSLIKISKTIGRGYGTINRVTKNLSVSEDILRLTKSQQGGSKARSINAWSLAKTKASNLWQVEITLPK